MVKNYCKNEVRARIRVQLFRHPCCFFREVGFVLPFVKIHGAI